MLPPASSLPDVTLTVLASAHPATYSRHNALRCYYRCTVHTFNIDAVALLDQSRTRNPSAITTVPLLTT